MNSKITAATAWALLSDAKAQEGHKARARALDELTVVAWASFHKGHPFLEKLSDAIYLEQVSVFES